MYCNCVICYIIFNQTSLIRLASHNQNSYTKNKFSLVLSLNVRSTILVTDGGEGVCVDHGEKGAILEAGGPGPPGGGKGWQLALDSGGEET
jgi:hypothetical protein